MPPIGGPNRADGQRNWGAEGVATLCRIVPRPTHPTGFDAGEIRVSYGNAALSLDEPVGACSEAR
jgi:hypothetical protein